MSPACELCHRLCRVRAEGFCRAPANARVSKVMVHRWEEPPISGSQGSGAVFFSGCNMRCVFCQNYLISQRPVGRDVTEEKLAGIFLELQARGVHNINLVSPTPYIPAVAAGIRRARGMGLAVPVVYNTNAYETAEALRTLRGLVDVYLPDIKYFDDQYAVRYSRAPGYFAAASAAVLEMSAQAPELVLDESGIARKGLIIRHLVMPGLRRDSMRILDWIKENLPDTAVSLMWQYVPAHRVWEYKELARKVTTFEYQSVIDHFFEIGLTKGFMQKRGAATEECVPDF
ncbi:MAG: radical SAM protein [Firmicutes bacterium]|nr:radical SAM protein [Bacillota bacterium]